MSGHSLSTSQPAEVAIASPARWESFAERLTKPKLVHGELKPLTEIPLFCNPLVIFVANWALMMGALSCQVTYVTYPHAGMPLALFGISLASFLCGYLLSRMLLQKRPSPNITSAYSLDLTQLWQLNLLLCIAAILIMIFNWVFAGPPPAIGDPTSYLTYGRFKQVLFPVLVTVTVNATLDPVRWRKSLFIFFGMGSMILYVTRGLIMVALLQMFFVFALKTRISKRKLYIILGCFAAFTVVVVTVIGNARTAQDVFLEYLQIKDKYSEWPMAYLWLTSYVSIPFSNLCWVFARGGYHGPTLAFLYPLLPSFLAPADPHAYIHNDTRIIDGASTYLVAYALDFSYAGVCMANLLLGSGCAWIRERALPRQLLVVGVFLACLSFIFFTDMFTPLSTILQLAIQSVVQRRCFRWGAETVPGMVTQ